VCRGHIEALKRKCERVACTPETLRGFFGAYDQDRSGELGYEEMKRMVRTFKADIGGRDVTADLLHKWSNGTGNLTYQEFIERVLRLQPNAMLATQNLAGNRPTTPELMNRVAKQIKKRIYKDPPAVARAFEMFDRDHQGEVDPDEFREGIKALGVPATKTQIKKMFEEWDADGGGTLDMAEMSAVVLGTTQPLEDQSSASPTPKKRTPPAAPRPRSAASRSRGGAPRMPQEFMQVKSRKSRPSSPWDQTLGDTLRLQSALSPSRPRSAQASSGKTTQIKTVVNDPRSYIVKYHHPTQGSPSRTATASKPKSPSSLRANSDSQMRNLVNQAGPSATLGGLATTKGRGSSPQTQKKVAAWYPSRDLRDAQAADAKANAALQERLMKTMGQDGSPQAIIADVTLLRPNNYESNLNLP